MIGHLTIEEYENRYYKKTFYETVEETKETIREATPEEIASLRTNNSIDIVVSNETKNEETAEEFFIRSNNTNFLNKKKNIHDSRNDLSYYAETHRDVEGINLKVIVTSDYFC